LVIILSLPVFAEDIYHAMLHERKVYCGGQERPRRKAAASDAARRRLESPRFKLARVPAVIAA
jgi:hypothetical protein